MFRVLTHKQFLKEERWFCLAIHQDNMYYHEKNHNVMLAEYFNVLSTKLTFCCFIAKI